MSEVVQNSVVAVSSDKPTAVDVKKNRNTGIPVIGNVSWGTHFCQFYQTREDLIDVLVPYFKAGLESNEFCMWVTSEPLNEKEAEEAMRKAVPDFDHYLKRGQIEIVPHNEWYLKDGVFNLQRVLNAWINKFEQALAKGYDGIRVTGNTAWLEKRDWKNFADYEEEINSVIGKYRMIALCTYSIGKCSASEVVDVVRNHQFTLIRRGGEWELIESSELKKAKETLQKSKEKLWNVFVASPDAITVIDINGNIVECNQAALDLLGCSSEDEVVGKSGFAFVAERDRERAIENLKKVLEQGSMKNIEYVAVTKDGREFFAELSASVVKDPLGNPIGFVGITKDVTERKQENEAMRESEEKCKELTESISDVFFAMDKNLRYTYWNKASEKLTGISAKDAIGKSLTEVFPDVKGTRVEQFYLETLRTQQPQSFLNQYQVGGKDYVFEINAYPSKDCLSVFVKDITERKRAEEEMIRLSSAVKMTTDSIAISDLNGKIIDVNEATLKMYGTHEKRDLIKKNSFDLIAPEEREKAFAGMKEVLEKGYVKSREYHVVTKDGNRIPVEMSTSIMKGADGTPLGFVGISRDITERKKVEEELRETRNYLDNLLNYANAPIIVWDNENKISLFNNAFEVLTGNKKESVVGRNIDVLFPPLQKEEILQTIEKATKGEKWQSVEVPILCKGEETRIALWNSANVQDKDGNIVATIAQGQDITERKKLEQQLKEYAEHLEEKVEEKTYQLKKAQERLLKAERLAAIGEVATMVGHDLRNPLQAITNTLYLSRKKLESIPITEKEILEKHGFLDLRSGLKEQVEYMDKIISDLQDYAMPVKPKPVEIGLQQLINKTLSSLAVPENVKISIMIEADFPKLMLDPTLMQRVFSNLITNAVQAMPDGGQLTIRASKKEETALISIEDTGVGIPDENRSKLFTPLFTTKAKGQGFGLPVCKRLVEAHDGNITVESKMGKGSTFTVKIPLGKEVSKK
jgi:PAS domain S-box-containing protein